VITLDFGSHKIGMKDGFKEIAKEAMLWGKATNSIYNAINKS
jgi:hypothetical protein